MFFGVNDFVLFRLDKIIDVFLPVGQNAFERIESGIFVPFGVFCYQDLARRLLRYLNESVISVCRIRDRFPFAVFCEFCYRKKQVLFDVFVKSLFHLGKGFSVVLQIMEFVKRFGLFILHLTGVKDRHTEKGRIVAWLGNEQKTVEVSFLVCDRATSDVLGSVAHDGVFIKVTERVVVHTDLGIHIEEAHSFDDAYGADRGAFAVKVIRFFACLEQRLAAGFPFERVVQSDIKLVKVEIAYILRRFFQKLFGADAVPFGEVHDDEQ